MRVLEAVRSAVDDAAARVGTEEQEAELDALWDDPQDQKAFIKAAEEETAAMRERVLA